MIKRADMAADPHTDAASDWLMRRAAGPLSAAETRAFEAWLSQAPENRQAYEEVEWIWALAGAAKGQPRIEARRRWVARTVGGARPARRAVAAAMAAAVIGAGALGWHAFTAPKPLATQSFRTAVGQQATVTLPDGSAVTLNTDTVVRTRADGERRLVYLDKGQAFFKVAKDRRHPFVVTAAGKTVTALGTAFDVRVDGGALKVVLVEGKVRVEAAKPAAASAIAAGAGGKAPATPAAPALQATEMSAGSQLVAVTEGDWRLTHTDVARETSWLERQIVFDDQPLDEIVREMNRYTTRKMVIDDPRLAQRRLSGIYTVGDLAAFSEALKGYGVARLEEGPHGIVRVVPLQ